MKTVAKQSVNVELTTVTVEKAISMLERYSYERQRPLNEFTVKIYRDALKEGTFTKGSQMHIAYTPDGVGYLINGQHRLWAIIESQVPLQVSLLESQVDTIEEVNALYYREDANQRRTITDSIRATALSSNTGLSAAYLRKVASAVKLIEITNFRTFGASRSIVSPDRALKLLEPWIETAHTYKDLVDAMRPCDRNRMTTSPIMSVAMAILRDCPEKGYEFWAGVALDDGLKRNDPRKTLLDFIWKADSNKGKSRLNATYIARAVANCWNAFYGNEQLPVVTVPQPQLEAPIDLLGTTFRKKAAVKAKKEKKAAAAIKNLQGKKK